jgi:hypothetical protein
MIVMSMVFALGVFIYSRRQQKDYVEEDVTGDPDSMLGGRNTPRPPVSPVAPPNIAVGHLGTVHSVFAPQGYVAVDGGLYRARWIGGAGIPRPGIGSQVLVKTHPTDGLQARPAHGHSGQRP